ACVHYYPPAGVRAQARLQPTDPFVYPHAGVQADVTPLREDVAGNVGRPTDASPPQTGPRKDTVEALFLLPPGSPTPPAANISPNHQQGRVDHRFLRPLLRCPGHRGAVAAW